MRKPWLLLVAPLLVAAATDIFDKYQIRRDWAEQRLLDFTLTAEMPAIPAPIKNLGPDKASREVRPFGDAVAMLFASESFTQRYAARRKDLTPPPPVVARANADLLAEAKKNRAVQLDGLDKAKATAAQMAPGQRKQLESFIDAQMKQLAASPIDEAELARFEQLRVAQDKERFERALAGQPPEDPRVALHAALVKTLAATAPDAPVSRWSHACLRAGAACEVARAYARDWLKVLPP